MKSFILGTAYVIALAGFYPYSQKIDASYPSNLGTNIYLLLCVPLVVFVMNKFTKKEKTN